MVRNLTLPPITNPTVSRFAAFALGLAAAYPASATWQNVTDCPFCAGSDNPGTVSYSGNIKTFDSNATFGIPQGTGERLPNSGSGGTWKNDSYLGWFVQSSSTGGNNGQTSYTTSNGSSTATGLFNFGTTSANDRALGAVPDSGSGTVAYGLLIRNDSGSTKSTMTISYRGEQWRNSGAGAQTIAFSYAISAVQNDTHVNNGYPNYIGKLDPSIATGDGGDGGLNWVAGPVGSTFTSPQTGGSATALDGNAAANSATTSFTLSGLDLPANNFIFLRWRDIDDASVNDHGLAIDNVCVTLTAVPEPSTYAAGAAMAAMIGAAAWRRRRMAPDTAPVQA